MIYRSDMKNMEFARVQRSIADVSGKLVARIDSSVYLSEEYENFATNINESVISSFEPIDETTQYTFNPYYDQMTDDRNDSSIENAFNFLEKEEV